MKPFNVEEALSGKPVQLRNGNKVLIIEDLSTRPLLHPKEEFCLIGFIINKTGYLDMPAEYWRKNGRFLENQDSPWDIVGMYEEPRPTVTLTLPCPLNVPQNNMWFIDTDFKVVESMYTSDLGMNSISKEYRYRFDAGLYFASEEDAQAWVDAFKNNRK